MSLEGNWGEEQTHERDPIKNTLYLTEEDLQDQKHTRVCREGRDTTTADKGERFAKLHKREIRSRIEVNFQHLVLITPGSWDQS